MLFCFVSPGYSTMSPQEDSENPPGNNDPLSAGVDVGNHDDDLDLDTPPQTAALLSHKFHPYRHTHTHHHPLHTHHLQAAVTVHSVDAECWSSVNLCPPARDGTGFFFFLLKTIFKNICAWLDGTHWVLSGWMVPGNSAMNGCLA